MIDKYAFSTVWNARACANAAELIGKITDMGFSKVELNYQIPEAMISDIARMVSEQALTITSCHNYCPHPELASGQGPNADCPSVASIDEGERATAVAYTKRTIETAHKLGARAVVMHSGCIDMEKRTRELIALHTTKGPEHKKFISLQHDAIDEREQKSKEHFDAVCESYAELMPCAKDHQIMLGLENRFYYREIPSPDESKRLLSYFDSPECGYWHDVGHAYVLEKLGFYKPFEFLEAGHEKMIGMHLHDVIEFTDHQAPGTGDVPWHHMKRFMLNKVIKVLELERSVSVPDIMRSVSFLDALLE